MEQHGPMFDPAPKPGDPGVRRYRYRDGIAPASDFFRSEREMAQEAKNTAAAEAEYLERAKSLAARHRTLGTNRRDSAMRELMARADKALRDRTPEQVEDDRRWGEAVHDTFEELHGYKVTDVPYNEKWLERTTRWEPQARLTADDLAAYAEPHELDHDGGPVEWDQDEAEL